ncbi:MAG: LPS export ABC transporter permease LptF [Syntrophobacterales bacterium]|nr:LPS export ABC transporter permease LptF [Syntrophobacterales bacterium]
MPRILYRYLLTEILHPFVVSLFAFTTIVFSGRLMRLVQLIVVKGIGLGDILRACVYLLPYLLIFTLPMAGTVGIMLALMRLTVDHEIIALKVSGLSYRQLLAPLLAFSLAVAALTLVLTVYGAPWARRQTQALLSDVVRRRADLGIQEQVFNTEFKGLVIYASRVVAVGQQLEGIFLYDSRDRDNPQTVYARQGMLAYDPGTGSLLLKLHDGVIIRWDPAGHRRHTVDFTSYTLPLPLGGDQAPGRSEAEMSVKDLRRALARHAPGSEPYNRAAVELGQRFALPAGALILCLLAVPLGLSPVQHGRTWGLVVGLGVFLTYYIIFTASWRLAVQAQLSPFLAPWSANVLFAVVALYLWRRTVQERPLLPGSRGRPGGV